MIKNHYTIILAAGYSTRMGTCKASLLWKNQTLLTYQISQFVQAEVTTIVVLGQHNYQQYSYLSEGNVVINNNPNRGKVSSILTGLQALPDEWETLFISAVDQPRPASIYQSLLQSYYQHKAMITAPSYQGHLGHPLLFSYKALPDLKMITEENFGLRAIAKKFSDNIQSVECNNPIVLSDINTPESYKKTLLLIEKGE